MNNRFPYLVASSLILLFNQSAIAEDTFDEDEFYSDLPVIFAANRIPQTYLESASSITLITKEMIAAINAKNIPDILSIVPGFQSVFVTGNTPVTTYQGLGDRFQRRFQVLIDNRSVYTPLYGGVSWQDLPISINDIEKIEIIRGPNAAVFGSNSFSAVIAITTKHSEDEQGTTLSLLSGDNQWNDQYFRYANTINDTSYSFSLQNSKNSGLNNLNDNSEAIQGKFRLDSNISSKLSLDVQLGVKKTTKQLGTSDPTSSTNADPVRDVPVDSYFIQTVLEHKRSEDELLRIQFFRNVNNENNRFSFNIVGSTVNANLHSDVVRDDLELLYNFNQFSPFKFLIGLGHRNDSIRSQGYFNTTDVQVNTVTKVFSQIEWQATEKLIVKTGFMNENNKIAGNQSIPKLSTVYALDNQTSFRFNYTSATRAPVLIEYNADQRLQTINGVLKDVSLLGNLNIQPESIEAIELGYLHYFNSSSYFDLKLFSEKLTDIITFESNAVTVSSAIDTLNKKANSFNNSGKVTITGLELQLSHSFSSTNHLYAQYTNLSVADFNNTENNETRVPSNSYGLFWRNTFLPNHTFNLRYKKYDSFTWINSDEATQIDNLDISYQYQLPASSSHESVINIGAKNIINNDIYFNSSSTNDLAMSNKIFYINLTSKLY